MLEEKEYPKHTISIYVTNKPGVLMRVSEVFARRGYNIDSLVVSAGADSSYSRMTITAKGPVETLKHILQKLANLVDVLNAKERPEKDTIQREFAMIKISPEKKDRTELWQLLEHFKAITLDYTEKSLVIQVTGSTQKLDAFVDLLQKFKVLEIVRTGKMIIARGNNPT